MTTPLSSSTSSAATASPLGQSSLRPNGSGRVSMLPESDWLLWLNRLLQLAAASKRSNALPAVSVCDVGKDLANGVVLMTLLDYLAEQPLKTCATLERD
jgi:hypothetical protein